MALHTRIELSGGRAGSLLFRGSQARIAAIMSASEEISKQHMEDALERLGELTEANLVRLSPMGKPNPGTLHQGGRTPPRAPGTLKSSWSHRVFRRGDDVILEIGSDDPVSEYVDKGTGLHKTGHGTRTLIRPKTGEWLVVPASDLRIGGSKKKVKGQRNREVLDVRFLKSSRGQPAQHLVTRAQVSVRPLIGPIFRNAAYQAKRDMVRLLRGT